MDTIPYAIGDFIELFSQTKEFKKSGKKFELSLMMLLLVGFIAYAYVQVRLCILSYQYPDFSVASEIAQEMDYPGVLLCSLGPAGNGLSELEPECGVSSQQQIGFSRNETCYYTVVSVHTGKFQNATCLSFFAGNYTASANVTLPSTMYLSFRTKFTKILFFPAIVKLYDTVYWSELNQTTLQSLLSEPTFFVDLTSGSQFAVIYKEVTSYLNGTNVTDFWTTVSNMGTNLPLGTAFLFSFGTFEFDVSVQYVSYTWPTLLGILGGAGSLTVTIHSTIVLKQDPGKEDR
eukprot:TRINITY_DN1516_c0_g3_i2.p1 TRINITY_DN1516_c0_g3~~TRINITY_DN1516_c0_g3_i2.p1  ORF type:complete len:289 (-),score=41.86 TRINITY_DN1516_c0_g3_i2:274-1140(-)